MAAKTKYNMEKIRALPTFEDDLKEQLRNPEFRRLYKIARRRLDVSHRIMMERKKARLTQAQFAKKLHTSQSFVARVESGSQNMALDILMKILDILSQKQKRSLRLEIAGSY